MTLDEYQQLAFRTVADKKDVAKMECHALHGLAGEIGELHSIYQKVYQGHHFDVAHAKKEVGDILWFIAEYCSSMGWSMSEVAQLNIEKLKARFPEGFSADRSLNRADGDI